MAKTAKPNCSYTDAYDDRKFGYFVQWSNDYAVVKTQTGGTARIHKSNLTFECQ